MPYIYTSFSRHRHGSHFRSVWKTGTLELLCKEPAAERLQPLQDRSIIIFTRKCFLRQIVDLIRSKAKAEHIIQIKIMKLIW